MKHSKMQTIGLERIYRLFELAEQEFELHSERSNRYVEIILEIAKKARIRLTPELKQKFCKKCGAFLKEGKNALIEEQKEKIIVECLECKTKRTIRIK